MEYQRESSLVAYSCLPQILRKQVSWNIGTPGQVEFDFLEVWDYFKTVKHQKEYAHDCWQFFHVHPPGLNAASGLDVECAKGLAIAFGHPLFFNIVTFGKCSDDRTVTSYVASPKGLEQLVGSANHTFLKASYLNKLEGDELYRLSYSPKEALCIP